jgi:hypothetical protein
MSPDVVAVQEFEKWVKKHAFYFKSKNIEIELPHCLKILLVHYLFDLLEQNKLNSAYFSEVKNFLPF